MLEFICKIPESVGWTMVGAVGMLTIQLYANIIITVIKARFFNKEKELENNDN